MVFMRDGMFSKLEGDRANVIDVRIRGLQAWMREELKRRAWTRKKEGITYLQAYFHGEIGRRIAARRKLEYSVEKNCRLVRARHRQSPRALQPLGSGRAPPFPLR